MNLHYSSLQAKGYHGSSGTPILSSRTLNLERPASTRGWTKKSETGEADYSNPSTTRLDNAIPSSFRRTVSWIQNLCLPAYFQQHSQPERWPRQESWCCKSQNTVPCKPFKKDRALCPVMKLVQSN